MDMIRCKRRLQKIFERLESNDWIAGDKLNSIVQ